MHNSPVPHKIQTVAVAEERGHFSHPPGYLPIHVSFRHVTLATQTNSIYHRLDRGSKIGHAFPKTLPLFFRNLLVLVAVQPSRKLQERRINRPSTGPAIDDEQLLRDLLNGYEPILVRIVVFYELLTGELPLGRFAPPSQKVEVDVRLAGHGAETRCLAVDVADGDRPFAEKSVFL